MQKKFFLDQINTIAKQIIELASDSKIVLFYGEMGAGKTTLIKEICKQLHVEDTSNSPTFSLVNEYKTTTNELVYHFDFYRIENENEAFDMGIEDYLYSGNWCFIEWPQNIKNLLPLKFTKVSISLTKDNHRVIEMN